MRRILLVVTLAGILVAGCQPSNKPAVEDLSGVPPVSDNSTAAVSPSATPAISSNRTPSAAAPNLTAGASTKEDVERYLTWLTRFDSYRMDTVQKAVDQDNAARAQFNKGNTDRNPSAQEGARMVEPMEQAVKNLLDVQIQVRDQFRAQPCPSDCAGLASLYVSLMQLPIDSNQVAYSQMDAVHRAFL